MKKLFIARSGPDLERCFPVMAELRPHLDLRSYLDFYQDAHRADGYEIVAIEEAGEVQAVMGYRFLTDFVRGRHLYIDDLVTLGSMRSRGLGARLLEYAETVARESGCGSLRLCAVMENERGQKFYERHGWTKRAIAYTKKLK